MHKDLKIILDQRLYIPKNTKALLWDMDGVLLDTLGLDITLCNDILKRYFGESVCVSGEFIRSAFAYHPPEFWRMILRHVGKKFGLKGISKYHDKILAQYNEIRNSTVFNPNTGIEEVLKAAVRAGVKCAVVSNNPTDDVKRIISGAGIGKYFDQILGNDIKELKKKPAPDTYLLAAELMGISPKHCAVIEDSLLGAEAGCGAGCFTVGVATGGADFPDLEASENTDVVYTSFLPTRISMNFGHVSRKSIFTPNEFISHMIEHIAWRMCCEIDLFWNNNDWRLLGKMLGSRIKKFEALNKKAAALGMIDDGSAEVLIELKKSPKLKFHGTDQVDTDWFLSLRCEQLRTGKPLVQFLEGLCIGLGASIEICLCCAEDPHHAWEGIFRSVGIALNGIFTPAADKRNTGKLEAVEENVLKGDISVLARSSDYAHVLRKTSESHVKIAVDFLEKADNKCRYNVSDSIRVQNLCKLINLLAVSAGFSIQVDFSATVLSSSHVAAEDTALVLGRTLKEILVKRMTGSGVNGAGSSICLPEDLHNQPVRVGISVEGRKFWKIVSFAEDQESLRKKFIVGQKVCGSLFSEDLDDFLDGLSGGLGCSIMVHLKEPLEPDRGWRLIFEQLGKAIAMAFEKNPYRKGVPPGVKATLA